MGFGRASVRPDWRGRSAVAGLEEVGAGGVAGGSAGDAVDGVPRQRGFETLLFGVADEAAKAVGGCDGAMVEDEGSPGGGFGELWDVAGFFEDGHEGA